MKKSWENPVLDSLDITMTAGGPKLNQTQDAEAWYNEGEDRWEIPVGEQDYDG